MYGKEYLEYREVQELVERLNEATNEVLQDADDEVRGRAWQRYKDSLAPPVVNLPSSLRQGALNQTLAGQHQNRFAPSGGVLFPFGEPIPQRIPQRNRAVLDWLLYR